MSLLPLRGERERERERERCPQRGDHREVQQTVNGFPKFPISARIPCPSIVAIDVRKKTERERILLTKCCGGGTGTSEIKCPSCHYSDKVCKFEIDLRLFLSCQFNSISFCFSCFSLSEPTASVT